MRMLLGIVKSFALVLFGALLASSLWVTHQAQAQPAPTGPAVVRGSVQVGAPELSYQGRLLDPTTGTPRPNGSYRMLFSLYDDASGGTPFWSETKNVTVANGNFTTFLGDTSTLDPFLFDGGDIWLGVSVGADPEATPRTRLGWVPYAMHALDAASLNSYTANDFAPASHNHDTRYWIRVSQNTQFSGTLNAGQSNTWSTYGWPQSWQVVWQLRPTTTSGRITWTVDTQLGTDGNITYYLTVKNTGSVTTNFDAKYIVLQ